MAVGAEGHVYQGAIARGAWVDAEHLQAGFLLLNADESWSTVERVEVLPVELKAFNLSVADNHTYFVAANDEAPAVWVHNTCKVWNEDTLKILDDLLADPKIADRIAKNPKLLDGWKRVTEDFAYSGGGNFGQYWESAVARGNVTLDDMHDFASARNWKHPENPDWDLYPPNNGFASVTSGSANVAETFDRYIPKLDGDGNPLSPVNDTGRFIADDGASYTSRALPPGTDAKSQLVRYQVVEKFPVDVGPAVPWFDEVGGATQYFTGKDWPLGRLIDEGYIRVIKNPKIETFANIFKNPKLAGRLEEAGWSDDLLKQLDDDLADTALGAKFNESEALLNSWKILADAKRPKLRKDITTLNAVTKALNSPKVAKVFSPADIQDIATATGKSNSRPVPPALSEVLDNLTRTLEGLDLSKVTGLDTVKADLKQSAFGKVVGANWTLAHIAKNLNHFKQFDNLIFESVEKIDDVTGQAIRRVDVKGFIGKNVTLYEYKSVAKAPPTSFKEQFVKDLKAEGIGNLTQLKWIFDGKKLNALDKDAFVDELEKVKDALDDDRVKSLFQNYSVTEIDTVEELIGVMRANDEWFSTVFKVQ